MLLYGFVTDLTLSLIVADLDAFVSLVSAMLGLAS